MFEQRDNEMDAGVLGAPLELRCGVVLKNRLVKAAMSDSLGDGAGRPTDQQVALYRRWATGGAALSLIGEVQVDHRYPEKPGNLVLGPRADNALLARLADAGSADGAHIWPQLGYAGALAHRAISRPAGPSALNIEDLHCDALTRSDVEALPIIYARAAAHAQAVGFSGVEIHAGHGFLLSQFLSPLFNRRSDQYGGSIEARCRLLLSVVRQVRAEVGPQFAIAVKINSSDQLQGGLSEDDAIVAISLLGGEAVDLIDISGGTYFPGAPASSDGRSSGPYFLQFARRARTVTDVPLMLTGGFKTRSEAADAVATGAADIVGLARTMALDPDLPAKWIDPDGGDPEFPRFDSPPAGGITAWFTMRLTALADGTEATFDPALDAAIDAYESRDADRIGTWKQAFEEGS
jgi:2,4-dienoyl-CoA reductase-like NADH-dependent reductase (Old Yellow Enzyme family)